MLVIQILFSILVILSLIILLILSCGVSLYIGYELIEEHKIDLQMIVLFIFSLILIGKLAIIFLLVGIVAVIINNIVNH